MIWGLVEDDTCEGCGTTADLRHLLYQCPDLNQERETSGMRTDDYGDWIYDADQEDLRRLANFVVTTNIDL
jgi:hypothetical protein